MKFDELASVAVVAKTIRALRPRGVQAELVQTKADALRRLQELLPAGAALNTAGSTTLEQIGFTELLKSGKHEWHNLKDAILNEKDPAKQALLRKQSVTVDYFIGSVHAVTEDGQILVASNTGSQIPGYAYTSHNVIWIAGTQKIVPDFVTAMKRVHDYCLPLENKRVQKAYGLPHSDIGKLLIFNRENLSKRQLHLIFVNEVLGF